MKNTVQYTSEYVYNNIKVDKTGKIVENTIQEFEEKYGANYRRNVKVICIAEFLDIITNETKNITIESYNIIRELNKIMQSSERFCKLIRIIELKTIINGVIYKNVLDPYLKSEDIRIFWKNFYENRER